MQPTHGAFKGHFSVGDPTPPQRMGMRDSIFQDRLARFAAQHGATVSWSEERGEIVAVAPYGTVWNWNGARCIREWFSNGGQRWVKAAVRDAKVALGYGTRPRDGEEGCSVACDGGCESSRCPGGAYEERL